MKLFKKIIIAAIFICFLVSTLVFFLVVKTSDDIKKTYNTQSEIPTTIKIGSIIYIKNTIDTKNEVVEKTTSKEFNIKDISEIPKNIKLNGVTYNYNKIVTSKKITVPDEVITKVTTLSSCDDVDALIPKTVIQNGKTYYLLKDEGSFTKAADGINYNCTSKYTSAVPYRKADGKYTTADDYNSTTHKTTQINAIVEFKNSTPKSTYIVTFTSAPTINYLRTAIIVGSIVISLIIIISTILIVLQRKK